MNNSGLNNVTGTPVNTVPIIPCSPPTSTITSSPPQQQQQYIYYSGGTGTLGIETLTTTQQSPHPQQLQQLQQQIPCPSPTTSSTIMANHDNQTRILTVGNSSLEDTHTHTLPIISATGELFQCNQLLQSVGPYADSSCSTGTTYHVGNLTTTAAQSPMLIYSDPSSLNPTTQIQYENLAQYIQIPDGSNTQQMAPLQTLDSASGLIYSFNYSTPPEPTPITFTGAEGFEDLIQIPSVVTSAAQVSIPTTTPAPTISMEQAQFTINNQQEIISYEDFNDLLLTLPQNSTISIDSDGRIHLPPEGTLNETITLPQVSQIQPSSSLSSVVVTNPQSVINTSFSASSVAPIVHPMQSSAASFIPILPSPIKSSPSTSVASIGNTVVASGVGLPRTVPGATPAKPVVQTVSYSPSVVHTGPVPVINTISQPSVPQRTTITVTQLKPAPKESRKPVRLYSAIPSSSATSKPTLVDDDVEIVKTVPAPTPKNVITAAPKTYLLLKKPMEQKTLQDSTKVIGPSITPNLGTPTSDHSLNTKPVQIQLPSNLLSGQMKGTLRTPNPKFKTVVVFRGKSPNPTTSTTVFTINNPKPTAIRSHSVPTHQVYARKSAPAAIQPHPAIPTQDKPVTTTLIAPTNSAVTVEDKTLNVNGPSNSKQTNSTPVKSEEIWDDPVTVIVNGDLESHIAVPKLEETKTKQDPEHVSSKQEASSNKSTPSIKKSKVNGSIKNNKKVALSNVNQTQNTTLQQPPPPLRESLVIWEDGIGKLTGTDLKLRVNPTTGILEVIDYVPPPVPKRIQKQDENRQPPTLTPKSKLIPSSLKVKMKAHKKGTSFKLERRTKIFRYVKHNTVVGMVKTSSIAAAAKLLHNATSGKRGGKPGRPKRRRTSGTESDDEKQSLKQEVEEESVEPDEINTENSNGPLSPKEEELKEVIPKVEPKTDDESDGAENCQTCGKSSDQVEFFDGKYCSKCGVPKKTQSSSPKKKQSASATVPKKAVPIVSIESTPASSSTAFTVVPIFVQSQTKLDVENVEEETDNSDAVIKKRRGRRKKDEVLVTTKIEELPPPPRKSRPASKTSVGEAKPKRAYRKRSFDQILALRKARLSKTLNKQPPSPASSGRSSSIDPGNLEDEEEFNASSEDRDSSVERKSTKKGEFNWTSYLLENNFKGAPARLFRQPAFPPPNPFRAGKMLEAIDPQHQSLICVAHVVDTQGYRLRLRLTGYSDKFDFWVNADSLEIFPAGWCETHGFKLEPPPNIENFNWHKYLIDEQCSAADRDWFSIAKEENGLSGSSIASDIKIGMKLEAVDILNQTLTCVATIAQVINDRILIHFDSWESSFDYWTDMTSPFIHPVGWCEKNGFDLTPPKDFKSFTWEKYLKETRSIPIPSQYFRPLPPISFKKGMKLECVDKRNPFLVRVATVADVEDHQLLIHFDGWPAAYDYKVYECSPDIHPVGWCQATGHPLQPPPCESEPWTGPCPTFGCLGLGHIKGPKFITHQSETYCPYSSANMLKDLNTILPDRFFKRNPPNVESKRAESVTSSTTSSTGRGKRKLSLGALDSSCSNSSTDAELRKPAKLSRKSSSSIPELFPETDLSPIDNEEGKRKAKDMKDKTSDMPQDEPEAPILSKIETSISPVSLPPKKGRGRRPARVAPPDLPRLDEIKIKVEEPFLSTIQLPNIESTITASSCDSDRKHWDDIIESVVRRKSSTEDRTDIQPDTPSSTFSLPPSTTMTPITASSSSSSTGQVQPAEEEADVLLISSGQGPFEVTTKQLAEEIKSGNTFTTVAGVTISPSPLNNATQFGTSFGAVPSTMTTATSGHGLGLPGQGSANTTTVTTVIVPCVSPDVVKSQPNSPQLVITPSTSTGTAILETDLPINYTVNIKALQEIVKDISSSKVSQWTTEDVAKFVEQVPGCVYPAKQLETQKVDGEAFLMLNQIDLIEIMGFKMGPAIKLSHVLRLIHRNSN